MDTLYPAERHRRPRITPPAAPGPPLTDPAAARAWLDAERANLVAVTVHTSDRGWPGYAARLAVTLFRYLDYGGYYPEAAIIQGHGLRSACHIGDADAELATLTALGLAYLKQGRFQQAANYFQQTLTRGRDAGNRRHEAFALTNLGIASFLEGSYRKAIGHLQQALALCRETGDPVGEAIALHNLSLIDWRQGRYQQATRHCRRAVALCHQTRDRDTETHTLVSLGVVDLRLGRYQQGTDHLQRALALSRENGHRDGEAEALTTLGDVASRLGRHHEAIGCHRKALALLREIGDQNREAEALNSLGESLLAAGQSVDVCTQHTFALGLATQVGNKYEQARAHYGLARGYQATGEPGRAHRHWQQALVLFAELGAPEADQVRAQLAGHGRRQPGAGTFPVAATTARSVRMISLRVSKPRHWTGVGDGPGGSTTVQFGNLPSKAATANSARPAWRVTDAGPTPSPPHDGMHCPPSWANSVPALRAWSAALVIALSAAMLLPACMSVTAVP